MLKKLSPELFSWSLWRSGTLLDLGLVLRDDVLCLPENIQILQKLAIGFCKGENLICRPKKDHYAVMFNSLDNKVQFWTHLNRKIFNKVFPTSMPLEDIGFYTLRDSRVKNITCTSPLNRCELILTDRCNFKCPYCIPLTGQSSGTLLYEQALNIVNLWIKENLINVRFSGGEPTIWDNLDKLVMHCKNNNVKRIAVSTNGSANLDLYKHLYECGVNDFSISLDSACCSVGDKMAGNIKNSWSKVVKNIQEISKFCYVTTGVVFTEDNIKSAIETIKFADSLGVADIRIISAAQYNKKIDNLQDIPTEILDRHPILKYRVINYLIGKNVRGLCDTDSSKCKLVLDDMAVAGKYHYPCIIYMRQRGLPIGEVNENMRVDRKLWYESHNTQQDSICKSTCLDVCVDYNNKAEENDNDY